MKNAVLFVTYDGLLDPLGSSQILPYLRSIANHPRSLHIISFEKSKRFAAGAEKLSAELTRAGISWTSLPFTTRFGKLGKLWDLFRMYTVCLRLQLQYQFDVIHCRSHLAMQVGCLLHQLTGVRTIFDMRGLWVDERMDGGLWSHGRWLDRSAYRIYKRIERGLLACANHVVVLTHRMVPELQRLSPNMKADVTVIPCCADFDHFVPTDDAGSLAIRTELGIPASALVLSYLGSLGTWYLLDEMLLLFAAASRQRDDVHLLFITRNWQKEYDVQIQSMGLGHLRNRIHVHSANREQVPLLLGASDIMLSLIKPAYSKIASSPTKLAEAFALGIPVISNIGVGDVDQITHDLDAGAIIDLNDSLAFDQIAVELNKIRTKGGLGLRERARTRFGLEVAEQSYRQIYAALDNTP